MIRESLSGIDRVWLRMEDPTHPMMITVLLLFDAPIEFAQLQAVLGHRLLPLPRFRQRVVQPGEEGGSEAWEDDPSFDLDHHLKQISLPAPQDEETLRSVVGELMSTQLDFSRPLWQFHLVGPYGTGCALVGRVHHCLADGPALMRVLLALTDAEPNALSQNAPVLTPRAFPDPVGGAAARLTGMLIQEGFNVLFHPFRFWSLARLGSSTMKAIRKVMWRPRDPRTILGGELGIRKRVAWSKPRALAEVKAIGRAVGGTVNDATVAAVAGALRGYLESQGQPAQGLTIRAGLSVNLRAPKAEASLGNQAGAVLVDLPVGLGTPVERLQQVKRHMDEIKNSPEASVIWGLLNAMGKAPVEIQEALVETYCTRETAVLANVPGPEEIVYLAGVPLSTLMFWVPALGGAGLCLSIVSYADRVWFGICTDEGLVPDPETVVASFETEFEALWRSTQGLAPDPAGTALDGSAFETMSDRLDEAIAKLDALLES